MNTNTVKKNIEKLKKIDYTLVDKKFKSDHPRVKNVKQLREEAIKFIALCAEQDRTYSPAEAVDQYWHQMILTTQTYDEVSNKLGKKVHHIPFGFDHKEKVQNKKNYENYLADYEKIFGIPSKEIYKKQNAYCGNGNCT